MKYRGEARTKDGEAIILRSLCREDAAKALAVCKKAAGETQNMVRYADEWTMSIEQQAAYIERMQNDPKSLMLGAFVQDALIGVAVMAPPSGLDRVRHRATLGIAIVRQHWRKGIGMQMMRTMIDAAKTTALEQLELEVVSTNEAAIALYRRCGFAEFARHPRKFKHRDGRYADLVMMMLELH